ncbi:MAG: hypothetical protein ACRDZ3_06420 [Acidimicrobiia bacterium]
MTAWGSSAGAWPDLVQIVAIPPRPERRGLWKILSSWWLLDVLSGGGWEWLGAAGGSRPTRVVVRFRGREHPLFKEDSLDSAKEKCERIAREYDALGRSEWCQRYEVPAEFFR